MLAAAEGECEWLPLWRRMKEVGRVPGGEYGGVGMSSREALGLFSWLGMLYYPLKRRRCACSHEKLAESISARAALRFSSRA